MCTYMIKCFSSTKHIAKNTFDFLHNPRIYDNFLLFPWKVIKSLGLSVTQIYHPTIALWVRIPTVGWVFNSQFQELMGIKGCIGISTEKALSKSLRLTDNFTTFYCVCKTGSSKALMTAGVELILCPRDVLLVHPWSSPYSLEPATPPQSLITNG